MVVDQDSISTHSHECFRDDEGFARLTDRIDLQVRDRQLGNQWETMMVIKREHTSRVEHPMERQLILSTIGEVAEAQDSANHFGARGSI